MHKILAHHQKCPEITSNLVVSVVCKKDIVWASLSLSLFIRSLIPSSCAGPEVLVKVCAFGRAVVGVIHLCCVPLPFYQQSEKVESSVMAPKRRRASRRKAAPKKGKKGGRNGVVLDAVCVRSDFMWAHACSWSTVGRS